MISPTPHQEAPTTLGQRITLRKANSIAPNRNFVGGVANGALFNLVTALLDPSVVLVVFVSQLTDSNLLLGLVGVIRPASWLLPQLWMSGYIQSRRRAMPVYRYAALVRAAMFLALVVAIFTVQNPSGLLLAFFVLMSLGQLAGGVAGLSFLDIVGKVIPAARRGVFFSMRMGIGGLLGIGGGVVVRALLAPNSAYDFPVNFGLLFAFAAVAMMCAFLSWIVFVDEPPMEPRGPHRGLGAQLRLAASVWRADPNYRTYLQARVALILVILAVTPFITVYAQKRFEVPLSTLAIYPAIIAAFNLVGTVASGWASVRFGNQRLIRMGAALGTLILAMVTLARPLGLGATAAGIYFGVVFALIALRNAATNVSLAALNINVAPEDKRPVYIGFANTVTGVALLVASVSGVLVDLVGFEAFFVLALAPMAFGVWRLRTLEDPSVR